VKDLKENCDQGTTSNLVRVELGHKCASQEKGGQKKVGSSPPSLVDRLGFEPVKGLTGIGVRGRELDGDGSEGKVHLSVCVFKFTHWSSQLLAVEIVHD
jgi:hypothetical protein